MTRAIAVVSGKGGVGKTTLSVNLGVAFAQYGRHVIVLEANLTSPHVAISLGTPNPKITLYEVLDEKHHVTEAMHIHPSGLKVIPASISHKSALSASPEKLPSIIKELKNHTELIIIDGPPGLEENAKKAIESSDDVIIVMTADLLSAADALRTIKACEQMDRNVYGIVVNRFRNDDIDLTVESIETLTGKTVLAVIPEDDSVRHAVKLKHPVLYSHPDSAASKAITKLAMLIIGQTYTEQPKLPPNRSIFGHAMSALGFAKTQK